MGVVLPGQGELTPSLFSQQNPEIGNLSIFRFLTLNLKRTILVQLPQKQVLIKEDKNRGRYLFIHLLMKAMRG
jgi:hypothetical protein